MTEGTYVLVVLSAVTHAYWNFLLKRSGGSSAVVGLSKVVEAVLLAPPLVLGVGTEPAQLNGQWILPIVGAVLVLLNYVFLAAAYRRGDLALVYPVSRGGMLLFLPPLAYVTIGERISSSGWIALAFIIIGIAALQLPGLKSVSSFGSIATLLALLASFTAACYTIWDKRSVQILTPFTYFAAYTVLVGGAYLLILLRTVRIDALREAWVRNWGVIVQVGILNVVSYMLALVALRNGHASYVIALRQLSIAIGAILGWRILGEPFPIPRRLGIGLVVAGCVLLALAR